MISIIRTERFIARFARNVNWIAAAAIVAIMFLTTLDVTLRSLINHPIPGTFELVGFIGSMAIAFSLPYTTLEKGHIAVEFLVQRLPRTARVITNVINSTLAFVLFTLISWQSALYAITLKNSGEVSATLQMPTYPFVFGVSAGCAMLVVVLIMDIVQQFRGVEVE